MDPDRSAPPADAASLLGVAVAAAGLAARRHRDRPDDLGMATKSSTTDPVTLVDRESEMLIVDHILGARPDDGVVGEEGAQRAGTSGVTWVVDPLDGTVNYVYGLPSYGVSIAADVDGTVVAGVVHDSARDEVFSATLGGGAWLDGTQLGSDRPSGLGATLLATGFGYTAERRAWQATVLAGILPRVRDIRRGGSAAVDLAGVAAGRIDAFYEVGLSRWDMAAGALLCVEAGLVVRWDPDRRRLLVAAPPVVDALDRAIAAAETSAGGDEEFSG